MKTNLQGSVELRVTKEAHLTKKVGIDEERDRERWVIVSEMLAHNRVTIFNNNDANKANTNNGSYRSIKGTTI